MTTAMRWPSRRPAAKPSSTSRGPDALLLPVGVHRERAKGDGWDATAVRFDVRFAKDDVAHNCPIQLGHQRKLGCVARLGTERLNEVGFALVVVLECQVDDFPNGGEVVNGLGTDNEVFQHGLLRATGYAPACATRRRRVTMPRTPTTMMTSSSTPKTTPAPTT